MLIAVYKIKLDLLRLLLPKHFKVIFSSKAEWKVYRWRWLKYGRVPVYARPEFQRAYRDRLKAVEPKKHQLRMPKGAKQETLF